MVGRRAILTVSSALVLVVAIGLAAGVLQTPSNLFSNTSGPLASTSVTLPAVLLAGLADGINPCAFTVLLIFVTSVLSVYGGLGTEDHRKARGRLFVLGGVFIFAIFLTYLSLGTGLLRVSNTLSQNHVGSRVGALVAIFMGLWMLKDYLAPGWGPSLGAPKAAGSLVRSWTQRASAAAMFGLGVLIGLCTVPCSGAVYFGILSLLALQDSFARSYAYLLLYNFMFVLPLVAILVASSTRPMLNRLAHWNLHHRGGVRLALGSAVVVMGLAILATV